MMLVLNQRKQLLTSRTRGKGKNKSGQTLLQRKGCLFLAYRDPLQRYSTGGDLALWSYAEILREVGFQVYFFSRGERGLPRCENVDDIFIIRKGNFLTAFLNAFLLYLTLRKKIAIVFEDVLGGFRVPYLSALYIRKPLVAIWHQYNAPLYYEQMNYIFAKVLSFLERIIANIYDRSEYSIVVTYSVDTANVLRSALFKQKRINVVPLFLPEDFIKKASEYAARNAILKDNICLFLGKIRRYKKPEEVIKAVEIMRSATRFKDIRCIIAGRVSEYDKRYIRYLYKLSDENEWLKIRTNISEYEKIKLINASKVLVVPSPIEGFGYVVLEANFCGTPVIAKNVPSDVLMEGYNGFKYQGIKDLIGKMMKLFEMSEKEYLRLSLNAKKWVTRFSKNRTKRMLLKILQQNMFGESHANK